ncbi:hypothetical protein EFW57_02833 [Bacillus velezensis]|nr:hypothetical protein EFW57_02833 [Bacillus velezensis]
MPNRGLRSAKNKKTGSSGFLENGYFGFFFWPQPQPFFLIFFS